MKQYLGKVIVAILAVLAPIHQAILAMGVLIFIDLIMGITASLKNGESFSSKRLKNTGVKLLIYNLLLIASFISEQYLVSWIPFTNICLAFLATVEVTSVGENFQKITGLPFIKYLKDNINRYLDNKKTH